ncbi:FCD domain-containing protein, partial [Streptomyces milbemycinicus]
MLSLAEAIAPERWAGLRPFAEATAVAAAKGDRAAYLESDRTFHQTVLGLAGNQQLVIVADDLHRRAQWPLACGRVTRTADLVADAEEHMALLDALTARDLDTVESLTRAHFAPTV